MKRTKIIKLFLAILFLLIHNQTYTTINSCISSCLDDLCNPDCVTDCSRTFFRPRSSAMDSVLYNALDLYALRYKTESDKEMYPLFTLQSSAFFKHSTNQSEIGRYLTLGCKNCIRVEQNNTSDFSSLWIALVADLNQGEEFKSIVSFSPTRNIVGGTLKLHMNTDDWLKNTWIECFLPIVHTRHDLGYCETLIGDEGGDIQIPINIMGATAFTKRKSFLSYLTSSELFYQRVACNGKSKTGLDDALVRFGWDFCNEVDQHRSLFGLVFIPTGHQSKADYIFEPTLGSGGHTGIGFGFNADKRFMDKECGSLTGLIEFRYAYFLKGVERRAIDLCNGGWTRFFTLARNIDPTNHILGPNELTLCVNVKPKSMIDLWLALHYASDNWDIEVGYDLWWRQEEEITRNGSHPVDSRLGIFDIPNVLCTGVDLTSWSTGVLSQAIPNGEIVAGEFQCDGGIATLPNGTTHDSVFTTLEPTDLNLISAQHRRALSSKIYAAFSTNFNGCTFDECDFPMRCGFGFSYEHAHGKGALSQVGVWLKSQVIF